MAADGSGPGAGEGDGASAAGPGAPTDGPATRRATAWVEFRGIRRIAWLYAAAAVLLLPWIVYLAETLPRRDLDRHYRAAWVGFDLLLVFAVARTAYFAFKVDPRVQLPATATATLLLVDAWFDVLTSSNRGQAAEALLLAVLVELPCAAFSIYLTRRVNREVLRRAGLAASVPPEATGPPPSADP